QSQSLPLLQDVQLLLLGFGIKASLTMDQSEGGAFASGALSDRPASPLGAPRSRMGDAASMRDVSLPSRDNAESRRHGLRIDPGSLRSFAKHIALLPGAKLALLASACGLESTEAPTNGNFDSIKSLFHLGKQQVFDL